MGYWIFGTKKKKTATQTKTLKRKTVKTPLKRKVGFRNLTDKEAKREGRPKRKKGYVNTTDGAKRKSHQRRV